MALGGGYFKTSYADDLALVDTRLRRAALVALGLGLVGLPLVASRLVLDLAAQVALAAIGALALNLLTGLAGQISLGHAGFIAAAPSRRPSWSRAASATRSPPCWRPPPLAAGSG